MSVVSFAPWGSNPLAVQESVKYREQYRISTGLLIDSFTSSRIMESHYKTRSAKTTALISNGWRLPSAANARIAVIRRPVSGEYSNAAGNFRYRELTQSHATSLTPIAISQFTSDFSSLTAASDLQALSGLRDQKMELGVSILEARKTINHLADTSIRLLKVYQAFRKRDFGGVARELGLKLNSRSKRDLGRNWLEYQYAWRPLIMDVSAAYDIVQNGLSNRLTFRSERAARSTKSVNVTMYMDQIVDANYFRSVSYAKPIEVQLESRTILYTEMSRAYLDKLGTLGLLNPLEVAWELVPWSFVIDWFVPVGTFLSALSVPVSQQFVSGTRVRSIKASFDGPNNEGTFEEGLRAYPRVVPHLQWKLFEYSRAALTSFPTPKLYWGPNLSTNKVVSAVALIRQVGRR